ncbi:hypothetical protein FH972_024270 [Carpinus fangiana]|uniref:Probable acetate kinase n=1 Tax=Carpinus fangiana TaxID=176857 RepID=A0A5N6KXJ9_9ROSI|nr:hypothetical protein FH972_024270 [Carpinus fangiana]
MAEKASVILAINAGSSSLKISAYKQHSPAAELTKLAEAQISGISSPPAKVKYARGAETVKNNEELAKDQVTNQASAFAHILKLLTSDDQLDDIKGNDHITHACHRIVHGGDYPKLQVIDSSTFHHIEQLSDLAPLHNGPALSIVTAVSDQLPHAKNVACFDSSFHSTIPEHIRTYPIDQSVAKRNKLRKYGFHGISYSFITGTVAQHLGKPKAEVNIIALHLGSGSSACAIKDGESHDTSMGLTPVSGLPGGTRSGSIEPATIFHYTHDAGKPSTKSSEKMHITQAEDILNGSSGFKGLTGTADFGDISSDLSKPKNKLAYDLFVDRVLDFVGAYWLKLGGDVDAFVFAGGIGEKAVGFRDEIVQKMSCLGVFLDKNKNSKPGDKPVEEIGATGSKCRVLVVKTDEQLEMATGVVREGLTT